MFDISENFIKKHKLVTEVKKLPEECLTIKSLFSTGYNSDADDIDMILIKKNELHIVNKILNFSKNTFNKIGFVMNPEHLSRNAINYDGIDTYIDVENNNEINYRDLFQVSFDYAALIYYKQHFNDTFKDLTMLSLLNFRKDILNAMRSDRTEPYYESHRESILDTLSTNFMHRDYMLYLNMRFLDSQFILDQKAIYNSLSNKNSLLFNEIVNRA